MTTTPTSGAADLPKSQYPAAERDELLQVAIDFIGTLTGMKPPPIEVAPPEVFAPFRAFVDQVQSVTSRYAALAAGQATTAQPGAAYAALPDNPPGWVAPSYLYTESQMRAFADATCAMRASHGKASAGATLPEGWVPLLIIHEGQYPEEIAYGPQRMMDRLDKWLRKYFDSVVAAPTTTAQAAPAAVAGAREAVKFTDQSTADPVEKARRYLTAMGDQRTNSAYFYDDGYPRRESAQDALATLAVLEQLAAAPTTQPAPQLPERDASVPAEQQGLFRKFDVRRVDGSDQPGGKHHGCRYFVLDVDHDQHAHDALTAYAAACESSHPELAADLRSKWGAALAAQPVERGDALDAARWRWLSEHIQVAWNEGKFTSLVRIVSEQHRQSINASVDRMMAGDWSDADAARAAQEGGWMPIETAPKDSGYLLLRGGREQDVASGYWLQAAYAGNGAWIWPFVHMTPRFWAHLPPTSAEGVEHG